MDHRSPSSTWATTSPPSPRPTPRAGATTWRSKSSRSRTSEKAHQRLQAAGVEVVGPLDHDGWVKSIYFFDPNGARLELTTVTGAHLEADYRANARAELDAWTREKRETAKRRARAA
jgi:hypothetical protein